MHRPLNISLSSSDMTDYGIATSHHIWSHSIPSLLQPVRPPSSPSGQPVLPSSSTRIATMPLDTTTTDTYTSPSSTPHPYDSSPSTYSSPNSLPAHIDLAGLPHGLPILGPLTGYTTTNLAHIIQRRYADTSQMISRGLSETEMTAIAYHMSKGHAIASYGPSLGIGAALYRIRATRAEFRWPFYGKLMSEEVGQGFWDGHSLRIGGREVMKSIPASAKAGMLHFLRGTAYVAVGMFIVSPAVASYGATVSAVGELKDQRLVQLTQELKDVADMEMKERRVRREEMRNERIGQTTGQGSKDAGRVYRERRERLGGKGGGGTGGDDDMSPTGGAFMSDYGDDEEQGRLRGAGDMGGVLSDGQMQTREVQAQPEARRSPTENRASTFQMEKVARLPQNFGDDFDDASPTGESGAMAGGGGGSAWERIRQQNASGSSTGSEPSFRRAKSFRREQPEGSTTGDSFSFSNSEEERNYAKDEAQKEFDERVEKERRGGDFSGGGGSGWRR